VSCDVQCSYLNERYLLFPLKRLDFDVIRYKGLDSPPECTGTLCAKALLSLRKVRAGLNNSSV